MLRFLATLFVVLLYSEALACSCDLGTIDERFDNAVAVFRILVTATELRPSSDLLLSEHFLKDEFSDEEIAEMLEELPNYVRVSFEVVEAFKGQSSISTYLYEMTFSPGNCGLGLMTGIEYVIFSTGEPIEFATFCAGSFGFFNPDATEVKPDLDRLQELAQKGLLLTDSRHWECKGRRL